MSHRATSHWSHRLTGARPHGTELQWLGPDAELVRSRLGDGALTWAVEVGEDIATTIAQEIPPLGEGAAAYNELRRATTSTALRALILVAGIGQPDAALASPEVDEIARDFARRGMELEHLLRSIRVGYAVLAGALLDAATALAPPAHTTGELREISMLLFGEMDDFTGVAATAFLDEQSTWAASVSAARFDIAKTIIDAGSFDLDHAGKVLEYPLHARHLGLIAWRDRSARDITGHDLRSVVGPVLRHWGVPTATLVVPVGSHAIWAWGAVSGTSSSTPGPCDRDPLPEFPDTHIAVGQIHAGVAGFRRTHLEARAAERLVRLHMPARRSSTAHEDVDLEALLLADPTAAEQFVEQHLGPLASADPRMTELRTTLRRYLDFDHSLAKTAAAEHISRNTVTYRVQQALSLTQHRPGTPSTKLRAALLISWWIDSGRTEAPMSERGSGRAGEPARTPSR
jgi:hypothetical protein